MPLIYSSICPLQQIHLLHSHQHVLQGERTLVLNMLKLGTVNSAPPNILNTMSLTMKDLVEVEKSKPVPSKNPGLYLEPSSLRLELDTLKYTHTQTQSLRSNTKAWWHEREGLLWHRNLEGALQDGPLRPSHSIPPASLDCPLPPLQVPAYLWG